MDRNQKLDSLTQKINFLVKTEDGFFEEYEAPGNEELKLRIRSDIKAALIVRAEETGETQEELIERLIVDEWFKGAEEPPEKRRRKQPDVLDNIPF